MSILNFKDFDVVPKELRDKVMKYTVEILEAGRDITCVRYGVMPEEEFQRKWGVTYPEVEARVTMVKLITGGAKAGAAEVKGLWEWIIEVLKRRREGKAVEKGEK